MNPHSPSCPQCGKPLPSGSAHRLCPACLMAQALASGTVFGTGTKPGACPPPSLAEIAGKFPQFEILECLGRGGMGVVYKARQKSLNRVVAIKILAPEREHDLRFAERFAREAELLAKLSHPHIVTIHDFGRADGLFYIVMEFVDGVNLRDLLREGKVEPRQALAIVPPVCEALQYAHDHGVVHRDIKPENLLLDREGRVKIADFGIAALVGGDGTGERAGTPPYMAPEQGGAKPTADHRADIYALGVVLYEMLTGERPAKDVVAPSRKVQIDVRLDEIVLRAMEKQPELRYATATEFKTRVETVVAEGEGRETAPDPEQARLDACTRDPVNWRLFFVYFCPRDPRVVVPRRVGGLGWTLNFARPLALPVLAAFVAFVLAFMRLVELVDVRGNGRVTMLAVLVVAVIAMCHRLSRPSGFSASEEEAGASVWRTYLKAAAWLLPLLGAWAVAAIFVLPKLNEVNWPEDGLGQIARPLARALVSAAGWSGPLLLLCAAGLVLAEAEGAAWRRLRGRVVMALGLAGGLAALVCLCMMVLLGGLGASMTVSRPAARSEAAPRPNQAMVPVAQTNAEEILFGGVKWQAWRTLFAVRAEGLVSLPKVRPGFDYGHWGHGRGPEVVTHIGDPDWRDYRIEADLRVPGVDPAFNPHGLGLDFHGAMIAFHVVDSKESFNESGTSAYALGFEGEGNWSLTAHYNNYCRQPQGWGANASDGERKLASGGDVKLDPVKGNRFRLDVVGKHIQIWLDDRKIVDLVDELMDEPVGGRTLDHGGVAFIGGFDAMIQLRSFSVTHLRAGSPDLPPPAPRKRPVVIPGLVAWWSAENDGDDRTGRHPGFFPYGSAFAPGIKGKAFDFDGSQRRLSVPDSPDFAPTEALTVSAWINPRRLGGFIAFRGDNRTGLDSWFMDAYGGNGVKFGIDDEANHSDQLAAPLRLDTWQHVVGTWDRATGTLRLYVDGDLAAERHTDLVPIAVLDPTQEPAIGIGNHGGMFHQFPFDGLIDEVRVYRRALTPGEISALHHAGAAAASSDQAEAPPPTPPGPPAPGSSAMVQEIPSDSSAHISADTPIPSVVQIEAASESFKNSPTPLKEFALLAPLLASGMSQSEVEQLLGTRHGVAYANGDGYGETWDYTLFWSRDLALDFRQGRLNSARETGTELPLDDPLAALAARLETTLGEWINGTSLDLNLPPTASPGEVLRRVFVLASHTRSQVAAYRVLQLRPKFSINSGAGQPDEFSGALVWTDEGRKIVLFRHEGDRWWSRIFDAPKSFWAGRVPRNDTRLGAES